jgi:hypothetical protein
MERNKEREKHPESPTYLPLGGHSVEEGRIPTPDEMRHIQQIEKE